MRRRERKNPGDLTRARLLRAIEENPGIHKSEVCRITGLAWGTVSHHVAVLRRGGELDAKRFGRRLHFVVANRLDEESGVDAMRCIQMPHTRRILHFLSGNPETGPQAIGNQLSIPVKAVRRHLEALADVGFVENDGAYHPKFWVHDEANMNLLEPRSQCILRESPLDTPTPESFLY